jgi:tetratricopeptide (TPR) repeat protein
MNIDTSSTIRSPLMGLVVAAALAAGLPGCTTTTSFEQNDQSDPAHYGENDEPLGNEAPTVRTLHSGARMCAARGQDSQAELAYAQLIERHPHYMPGYAELSELYLRNEMADTAVAVLNAGLEVSPDDAVLRNNLGMCHLFLREYEAALEQFVQAAATMPEDARSRANMAVALGMLGRMDEAYANYQLIVPEGDARHNMRVLSEVTGFAWSEPDGQVLR